jgi:hypothetical protein
MVLQVEADIDQGHGSPSLAFRQNTRPAPGRITVMVHRVMQKEKTTHLGR